MSQYRQQRRATHIQIIMSQLTEIIWPQKFIYEANWMRRCFHFGCFRSFCLMNLWIEIGLNVPLHCDHALALVCKKKLKLNQSEMCWMNWKWNWGVQNRRNRWRYDRTAHSMTVLLRFVHCQHHNFIIGLISMLLFTIHSSFQFFFLLLHLTLTPISH